MRTITRNAKQDASIQMGAAEQPTAVSTASGSLRIIRRGAKMFTMWAYGHGYISFRLTQQIFGWFDFRDV